MIFVLERPHNDVHVMGFFVIDFWLVDHGQLGILQQVIDLEKTKDDVFVDVSDLECSQMIVLLDLKLSNEGALPLFEYSFESCVEGGLLILFLRMWT